MLWLKGVARIEWRRRSLLLYLLRRLMLYRAAELRERNSIRINVYLEHIVWLYAGIFATYLTTKFNTDEGAKRNLLKLFFQNLAT